MFRVRTRANTPPWCNNGSGQAESQPATLTVTSLCQDQIYTSNSDFDNGVLINLNHDTSGELRLNTVPTPLPYVNMACTDRETIVRIDANSGAVLGEYRTAIEIIPDDPIVDVWPSPNRTAVDRHGNVWVSNRYDNRDINGVNKGSVARIGVVIGGVRGDRGGVAPNYTFTPNPQGEYLSPPFIYNTCLDREADGYIRTSRGLGHVLSWQNANGADTDGGVESAQDEAILNYVRVAGTGVRTVAVDANNDVWTGGWDERKFEKLDGVTGQPCPGTQFTLQNVGGYCGLVDGKGDLWSSTQETDKHTDSKLLKYTPLSNPLCCINYNSHGDYGLAIDPITQAADPTAQHVWHSQRTGSYVWILESSGAPVDGIYHGANDAQGVAVDCNNNVWVAHCNAGEGTGSQLTVGHIRTDMVPSKWIGNVHLSISPNIKPGPTGVAVDANGKVWVSNMNANNAMRINPNAGPYSKQGNRIGAVDLTVDLGDGSDHQPPHNMPASPYNCGDMTGYQFLGATSRSGCWVFVQDGHGLEKSWNRISWSEYKPAGTQIQVEVRAANKIAWLPGTGTTPRPFQTVSNGQLFGGVIGRYLEVRVTLSRSIDVASTPVLYSLTVHCPSN
jgi:streptogramin lyase